MVNKEIHRNVSVPHLRPYSSTCVWYTKVWIGCTSSIKCFNKSKLKTTKKQKWTTVLQEQHKQKLSAGFNKYILQLQRS